MNIDKRQSVIAGVFLIVLGIVWTLDLWWLLVPGALATAGVAAYITRRSMGRQIEAVQGGLWGVGLALLWLLGFMWPGILFLAGLSILVRGREQAADTWIQTARAQLRRPALPARTVTVQQVPLVDTQTQVQPTSTPTLGETTRLSE